MRMTQYGRTWHGEPDQSRVERATRWAGGGDDGKLTVYGRIEEQGVFLRRMAVRTLVVGEGSYKYKKRNLEQTKETGLELEVLLLHPFSITALTNSCILCNPLKTNLSFSSSIS